MNLKTNGVVVSLAGRDKGKLLAIMRIDGGHVYVCDGKERPLLKPKRKNVKHVRALHYVLSSEKTVSDPALRKALLEIRGHMPKESEV